jgi:hypothetical protein
MKKKKNNNLTPGYNKAQCLVGEPQQFVFSIHLDSLICHCRNRQNLEFLENEKVQRSKLFLWETIFW